MKDHQKNLTDQSISVSYRQEIQSVPEGYTTLQENILYINEADTTKHSYIEG
jgi:hypothetical protein